MFGRERKKQVGISQLAFVPDPLVLIEVRERCRLLVPVMVNVHAPSRWGIPASQSRSAPPDAKAGTRAESSGWTGPQW